MITRLILKNERENKNMKIKKTFQLEDLKNYLSNGAALEAAPAFNTYGTAGNGYVRRQGYYLTTPDKTVVAFQIIFTSKGYGTMSQELTQYNHRWHDKYDKYDAEVNEWIDKNISYLLKPFR